MCRFLINYMTNLKKLTEIIVKANPYKFTGISKDILADIINLEDCLMSINIIEISKEKMLVWAIGIDGEFFDQDGDDGSPIYKGVFWKFGKHLRFQSQETIDYLLDILI